MDLKLLRQILFKMSKGTFHAIIVNCIILTAVYASDVTAQQIQSVKDVSISLKAQTTTLNKVLRDIESLTDYRFSFRKEDLDGQAIIATSANNATVAEVLLDISKTTGLKFRQVNNNIYISKKDQGVASEKELEIIIQGIDVTGRVVSADDEEGLPGVNVMLEGTSTGTVTDINGNFKINVPSEDAVLVFSSVGYISEKVGVGQRSVINLTLMPDITALDEIVVVGYGTQEKKDLTGSVGSVSSEEIMKVPTTGLDQALQGRVAGVYVAQSQSEPGGNITVRVRGSNSIQGNNDPLYVIDGFIGGNIQTVDPSDIASIDILKDASSTAIYGTRGANGVILITTKTGKIGKNQITFDSYYGFQKVANKLDLMNAHQFAEYANALETLNGNSAPYDLSNLPNITDWQDELFRVAPMQSYNLASSGGTNKITYYLSGNYIDQQGIMIGSGFKRFNFRTNVEVSATDKLKLGTRLGISRVNNNRVLSQESFRGQSTHQPLLSALILPPTTSPYDADGNLNEGPITQFGTNYINPVATQENWIFEQNSTIFNGNIYASLDLFAGLNFKTTFGTDININKGNQWRPSTVFDSGSGLRNYGQVSENNVFNWISENYFTYKKEVGKHGIETVVGFTAQKNEVEDLFVQTSNFSIDQFEYHNLGAGDNVDNVGTSLNEWSRASFYGRFFYKLNEKYLFTFNGRYDGSSRFGNDSKWGFFPSGAIAWRLGDEEFLQQIELLSELKLRASYGVTGSDALNSYQSLPAYGSSFNAYNLNDELVVGFLPNRLGNSGLSWESTSQFNVGLDAGFLEGRLNLTADYYVKTTDDLFLNRPLPQTNGVSSIQQNIGSIENRGLELGISATLIGEAFSWKVDINTTFNRSKVLDLGDVDQIQIGNLSGDIKAGNIQIIKVGEEMGSFYGYETMGIWQTDDDISYSQFGSQPKPGDIRFVDRTGDGDVNDLDRTILGNATPNLFGGFNNTFSYQNFDLSIFLQFATGNEVLNANNFRLANTGTLNNKLKSIGNFWTTDNPSETVTRIGYGTPNVVSSRIIESGDFLRLREITLGYSLPSAILQRLNIDRLRFYLTGTNLFLITDYSGYDPEVNVFGNDISLIGTDNGAYPKARTIFLGLNLTF